MQSVKWSTKNCLLEIRLPKMCFNCRCKQGRTVLTPPIVAPSTSSCSAAQQTMILPATAHWSGSCSLSTVTIFFHLGEGH